jgi:hypothetical protein
MLDAFAKNHKIEALAKVVILVKTGIQFLGQTQDLLDSRLRGNDAHWIFGFFATPSCFKAILTLSGIVCNACM